MIWALMPETEPETDRKPVKSGKKKVPVGNI